MTLYTIDEGLLAPKIALCQIEILVNINIDKILIQFEFDISNRAIRKSGPNSPINRMLGPPEASY